MQLPRVTILILNFNGRLHLTDCLAALRNALLALYKNYDAPTLQRVLPAALLLLSKRAERTALSAGRNAARYGNRGAFSAAQRVFLARAGGASLVAANAAIDVWPALERQRHEVQKRRCCSDAEILRLLGDGLRAAGSARADLDERYAKAHYDLADAFGVTTQFEDCPRRVLIVSGDLLPLPGLPTTGAGLRAWSLGQGLRSRGHTVLYSMPRAAAAGRQLAADEPLAHLLWEPGRLDEVVARAQPDVVVACGWAVASQLAYSAVPVVVDQHGPHMLERAYQRHQDESTNAAEKLYGLSKADFFLCAGTRQRRYFLSWLARAGFTDPEAQSDVVPVSLGGAWPLPEPFSGGEIIFVYGGVFLPWQDPSLALTTLVKRMAALGRGRLRIFGGKHPFIPIDTREFDRLAALLAKSPHVELSPMLDHAELLCHYRRAHVALDLMRSNPERELAFTTRTVEYLWCGLPVIYNNYAELADYIGPAGAGWCLDPEDAGAMTEVFDQILLDPEILPERARRARALAEERLNWARTIDPLDRFCRHPYVRSGRSSMPPPRVAPAPQGLRRLFAEAARHYRRGGVRALAVETSGFARRRLTRRP